MILGIYASERVVTVDGRHVTTRIDESFSPIAAETFALEGFPVHVTEACPEPLARIEAPDGWRVEPSGNEAGQVLAHPTRPGYRITPSAALLLAHAGVSGFSLARAPAVPIGSP